MIYRAFLGATLCMLVGSGCALTSKATPMSPRYFSPEQVPDSRAPSSPRSASKAAAPALQLGQVASASHLDERIAYRVGATELGFYDDRRWTELPEAYLRRALERELFEDRGLERMITGGGPTLDVELIAFEELRGAPTRARVTLHFSLHDERRSFLERSVDIEREVTIASGADPAVRLAETLSTTLRDAVRAVAEQVTAELPTATRVAPTPD
ncbi:MAG TPA: ABC-type transport auxiliary lipoprotein family protein [Polyangiaceae bacterium]|nr:ABC-type transport auxiliary lipoprotein family protein [Polyangiaceae bacterium]